MTTTFRIAVVCLLPCLCGGAAMAGERPARGNCAAYGPGFVGVTGTDTCVRIGGHVRVEYGWGSGSRRALSNYGASTFAPPPMFGEPVSNAGVPGFPLSPPFARLKPAGLRPPTAASTLQ